MSVWEDVRSGYDSDEETVNFGARQFVEAKDGAFECITMATFAAHGQVDSITSLQSMARADKLCVALDKSISLFDISDNSDKSCSLNMSFNSTIECLNLSEDGNFLFLCHNDGSIYILHTPTNQIIFSKLLTSDISNKTFCQVLLNVKTENFLDVLIVACNGSIYSIMDINLESLKNTLTTSGVEECSKQIGNLQVKKHEIGKNIQVSSAVLISQEKLLLAGNHLIMCCLVSDFEILSKMKFINPERHIRKLQVASHARIMYALQADGKIWTICPFSLLYTNVLDVDDSLDNFIITENLKDGIRQMLVLSKPNKDDKCRVKLIDYKGMVDVYEFESSSITHLVSMASVFDDVLFVEGQLNENCIQNFMLRSITKTQPEFRLQRLVRKRKFQEAAEFAERYNLDLQMIYKEEARDCIGQMSPWKSEFGGHGISYDVPYLINILEKIIDINFAIDCCMNAIPPNITETRDLLAYGRDKIFKHGNQLENSDELQTCVCHCIQRLDTFEIIFDETSTEQWLDFYKADLLKICVDYLQTDELGRASIVWVRHESELLASFNEEYVIHILTLVNDVKDKAKLFSWLNAFVPSVLNAMPQCLSIFTDWLHDKIRFLEWGQKKEWPQIALDYCESAISILQPSATEVLSDWLVHVHQQYSDPHSALLRLQQTRNVLNDLLFLHSKVKISISMAEYTEENKQTVVLNILTRTSPENLELVMTNLLTPIIQEHMLDGDQIIYTVIENVVSQGCWWFWDCAPWEKQVLALMKFLKNNEWILNCTLLVLKVAPVPWNANIAALLEKITNWNHPLASEVKNQKLFEKSKLILKKYNLCDSARIVDFSDLVLRILVHAILQKGKPEMLEDCLVLVHADPSLVDFVQSVYLHNFLKMREYSKAKQHLESLPTKTIERIATLLFDKIKSAYNMKHDELENYLGFFISIEKCLQKVWSELCPDNAEKMRNDMKEETKLIEKNHRIQTLHDIVGFDYVHLKNKRDIFLKIVSKELNKGNADKVLGSAMHLAKLLEIKESEAQIWFAEIVCERRDSSALSAVLSQFEPTSELSTSETKILQTICKNILCNFREVDPAVLQAMEIALAQALCYNCDESQEDVYQALLNDVQHVNELLSHCSEAYSVIDVIQTDVILKDPYNQWSFSPIYEDAPLNANNSCNALQPIIFICTNQQVTENLTPIKAELPTDDTVHLLGLDTFQAGKIEYENKKLQQLEKTVTQLTYENNDLLALKLINQFMNNTIFNEKLSHQLEGLSRMKMECILRLLKRILAARKADLPLALGLLLSLPQPDALKWLEQSIKRVRHECNHLSRITRLAMDFSQLTLITEHLGKLRKLHIIASWGKTFNKLGISNKTLMQDNRDQNFGTILITLIHNCSHLPTIKKFCTDFQLRYYEAMLYSLEYNILSWKPEVTIVNKQYGLQEMVANDYKPLLKRCWTLCGSIITTHKKELNQVLDSIWQKVNPYYYEMYLCVLKLKSYINPEHDISDEEILIFLIPYMRQVAPTLAETDIWLKMHPDDTSLPDIAKYRLSYAIFLKTTNSTKDIIESEVNLQSYRVWLKAPKALCCADNETCVSAVKNSVSKNLCKTNLEEWSVQSRDTKLISDIEECVECITDISFAAAALDYFSKRIPPGLDKLSIVQLCHQKLQVWKSECESDECKELDKKVTKRLLLYSAVHVLHMHDLGRKEYLDLAEDPIALVEALYNDPSIVKRGKGIIQHSPDIHAAANAIVQLHNLSIDRIRIKLVESWLLTDTLSSGSLDESFVEASQMWQQFDDAVNKADQELDENLLKVRYLLEIEEEGHDGIDYLIGISFGGISSAKIKLRALTCLLWIVPTQMLSELTGRDISSVREFAKMLYFMSELEKVQIIFSINEYEAHDKVSIIESLWRRHSQSPQVLMLMCRFSMHYHIFNPAVWANILSRMQQLGMLKELEIVLPKLNKNSHTLCTPQFISAWNKVLITPFQKANCPMTIEEEVACVNSLTLMQRCPLLKDVKSTEMFKLSLDIKRYDLAALILPFTSTQGRKVLIEILLQATSVGTIKDQISKMEKYCSLHTCEALQIIELYQKNNSSNTIDCNKYNGHII